MSTWRQWPAALLLLCSLIAAALAYAPGTGGTLHFDDPHNLTGLSKVVDGASALAYIASGDAGPTGRPVALASFAPQAYAWPSSPEVFLHTNICLHLLNGALVVWLVYLLCLARREDDYRAAWVAALSGTVWMLLPVLASSSLLIVQRMTVLSATFQLLGMIGYLYSRTLLVRRPFLALALMSLSVAVGGGLAVTTKESGALLPLFILVTELTLLPSPVDGPRRGLWRVWFTVVLLAPATALFGYLLLSVRYSEAVLLIRGFSGPERLLTEAGILWEYLLRALVPSLPSLGPFQDDHALHRDWLDPLMLLPVVAWSLVMIAAATWRRRFPWLAFAAAWYLVGHALESTTVALELYFEHRNYLPLIGPVVALVATATTVAPQWQTAVRAGVLTYAAVLGIMLFNATASWGEPLLAAEMWSRYHPDSLRAAMYFSGELQKAELYPAARDVYRVYAERVPTSSTARLQLLDLSCGVEPGTPQPEIVASLERMLPNAGFEYGAFDSLQRLRGHVRDGACDGVVDAELVYTLASILDRNPAFHAHGLMRHNLNVFMAEEAFERRDLDLTMKHLEAALDGAYTLEALEFAVLVLNSAGLRSTAADFLHDAYAHAPRETLRAATWRQQVAALEKATRDTTARE